MVEHQIDGLDGGVVRESSLAILLARDEKTTTDALGWCSIISYPFARSKIIINWRQRRFELGHQFIGMHACMRDRTSYY
jgi:hypothetical protein